MYRLFVLVVRDGSRLDFLKLYDAGLLAHWADTFEQAEKQLKSHTRFDAVIVDVGRDQRRAIDFCEDVHRRFPSVRVFFIAHPAAELPSNFCAELLLDYSLTERDIARELLGALRVPPRESA